MNKLKKIISSPGFTIGGAVLAAVLVIFGTIGTARSALNVESDDYVAHVQLYNIGVQLNENGTRVAWRDYDADGNWNQTATEDNVGVLCGGMLDTDGDDKDDVPLKLGTAYPEALTVTNSGTINEFVRVTLTRYWTDEKGNKIQTLDPSMIDLNLLTGSGWLLDKDASTAERTVLYYSSVLNAGMTTPALSDTLTIKDAIASEVSRTKTTHVEGGITYTTITTNYDYDGRKFCIRAEVDAVQEHNAAAAVKSAWGQNVLINGSTLSLSD